MSDNLADLNKRLNHALSNRRLSLYLILLIIIGATCSEVCIHSTTHSGIGVSTTTIVVVLSVIFLFDLKIGSPEFWIIAKLAPTSPGEQCAALLLKMVGLIFPRHLVVEKLGIIMRDLTKQDADRIDIGQWNALYGCFWHGSVQQRQIVIRAASLLENKQAIPYLEGICRCKRTPADLRLDAEAVIAKLSQKQ